MFEAVGVAVLVAAVSVVGALFFGDNKRLEGLQRFVVPTAVGIFLSLVLFELIPETLLSEPEFGGLAIAFGFISFYILANFLHKKFHHLEGVACHRKSAATLILAGDAVHNLADGIILGGAFLIDPTVGIATAIGLALHEIPQEIIEFGVLIRGGYSRARALLLNLLSASTIVVGTVIIFLIAEHAEGYIWILTGIAAGNLLYIAASDLLPRIHGGVDEYGGVWRSTFAIILGFVVMTIAIDWTHNNLGEGHENEQHDEVEEQVTNEYHYYEEEQLFE